MTRPEFYFHDRKGQRLDIPTADLLLGDPKYRCVRITDITSTSDPAVKIRVSTLWLGVKVDFGDHSLPVLFETEIFRPDADGDPVRYDTEDQAVAGHEEIVFRVAGTVPDAVRTEHEEWQPW